MSDSSFSHCNTLLEDSLGKIGSSKSVTTSILNKCQQMLASLLHMLSIISVTTLIKIASQVKKLLKMGNDIIMTSFEEVAQQFLCVSGNK